METSVKSAAYVALAFAVLAAPGIAAQQRSSKPATQSKPVAGPPPALTAPTVEQDGVPVPLPDAEKLMAFIRRTCELEWPSVKERQSRDLCVQQQKDGAIALLGRRVIASPELRTIRLECAKKWTSSFTMWDLCERQQIKTEPSPAAQAGPDNSFREPTSAEAVAIIRKKCAADWPDDFTMRAYCQKQQDEGIAGLQSRSMVTPTNMTIRGKCYRDWPEDFHMRDYCERRQIEAAATLR